MGAGGGPGISRDPEDIRRFRQNNRELYSQRQVANPALFVSMDTPLQGLAPAQQTQALRRLREIANAEGSAIQDRDIISLIDSSLNLEENEDILLEQGGRLPRDERLQEREQITEEDVESANRRRARDDILELCEEIDAAGADGAEVLEAIFSDELSRAERLAAEAGVGVAEVSRIIDSIEEEFGGVLVADAIAECRDRLAGPEAGVEAPTQDILDEFRERFDIRAVNVDRAFNELERQLRDAEEDAREAAVNRLSRSFGTRFDDLDDAVDRLRQRIAQARGERLRIADIRVRRAAGETRIFIDSDDPAFDQWLDNVQRRVSRELDLAAIEPPQTVTVGEVVLRGEQLEEIDLQQGRDRLGAIEEPQPLPEEAAAREQAELPEPETDSERLADEAIELAERSPVALVEELTTNELADLIIGINTAEVSEEREMRLREAIQESDPTLREDAVQIEGRFRDLETSLRLEASTPPPEDPMEFDEQVRERTQAERDALQIVEDLIMANEDDPEVLADIALALERVDADESMFLSQERIEALTDQDRRSLADRARNRSRGAEELTLQDFPLLDAALAPGSGRDQAYYANVINELRGDRELSTLANQDVDEDTLENLREFHPDVLEEAIDEAQRQRDRLQRGGEPSPRIEDLDREPEQTTEGVDVPGIERAIEARVQQIVPSTVEREDRLTGETFRANPDLERRFLAWVIETVGDTDRFDRLYFEVSPETRARDFIGMEAWARLTIQNGDSTVDQALRAGLPPEWFEDLR